jgi:hypothetical protein
MRVHLGPRRQRSPKHGVRPSWAEPGQARPFLPRTISCRARAAVSSHFPTHHRRFSPTDGNPNPSPWRRGSWPDPRPSTSPPPSTAPPPTQRRRSPEPARSRPCPATRPPRRPMRSARFVRVPDPSLLVLRTSYLQIGMGDCDAIL